MHKGRCCSLVSINRYRVTSPLNAFLLLVISTFLNGADRVSSDRGNRMIESTVCACFVFSTRCHNVPNLMFMHIVSLGLFAIAKCVRAQSNGTKFIIELGMVFYHVCSCVDYTSDQLDMTL